MQHKWSYHWQAHLSGDSNGLVHVRHKLQPWFSEIHLDVTLNLKRFKTDTVDYGAVLTRVIYIVNQELCINTAEDTLSLNQLGADSFDIASIILTLEDEFKVLIPDKLIHAEWLIADMANYLWANYQNE